MIDRRRAGSGTFAVVRSIAGFAPYFNPGGSVSVQLKYGEVGLHPAPGSQKVSLSKTLCFPDPGLAIA